MYLERAEPYYVSQKISTDLSLETLNISVVDFGFVLTTHKENGVLFYWKTVWCMQLHS